jgi:hypothetical protein
MEDRMYCPECRALIPDSMIACPVCATRRGNEALYARQLEPLRKIADGDGDLTTRALGGVRHVQLFGVEQTFCGLPIQGGWRKNWFRVREDSPAQLCRPCWQKIQELTAKAVTLADPILVVDLTLEER